MRDERLYPFFATVDSLPGVGSKITQLLEHLLGGNQVLDLLFHLPERWVDRKIRARFEDAPLDEIATVVGKVQSHVAPKGRNTPYRVRLQDDSGFLTVAYFRGDGRYLKGLFPMNKQVVVSGKIEEFYGERQILHPDHVYLLESDQRPPPVEPVYRLTAGLTNRKLHGFIAEAMSNLRPLPEWSDGALLQREGWPDLLTALNQLHLPEKFDPTAFDRARNRLAYDEALAREAVFAMSRKQRERQAGIPLSDLSRERSDIIAALPFRPTGAQIRAISDVVSDTRSTTPMRRMIQGDVGSGKTVVAALACAHAALNGFQSAVMAPTEVLARQLCESLREILSNTAFRIELLTGRLGQPERRRILSELQDGSITILAGTHALFQETVAFENLGLVVVDEQHRFGVLDRARLTTKGRAPHLLVMSATPIPRSLAMAVHGDLDVSILDEKPAGRKPVDTRALPDSRIDDIVEGLRRAIALGDKAFWVCPSVDSEDDDAAVVNRHAMLQDALGMPIAFVHGRLSSTEKQTALERFRSGDAAVLVATTVIEVGVDVPSATIMVIERAETFGLAQLHQLRGRVGRGDRDATCLLVYRMPLSDSARVRLDTLKKTDDGFAIAEADFNLRGPGDVLGLRQSGAPEFRVIDVAKHAELFEIARNDARFLLGKDPELLSERGQAFVLLRDLLGPKPTEKLKERP